jgi:hypothetical protein
MDLQGTGQVLGYAGNVSTGQPQAPLSPYSPGPDPTSTMNPGLILACVIAGLVVLGHGILLGHVLLQRFDNVTGEKKPLLRDGPPEPPPLETVETLSFDIVGTGDGVMPDSVDGSASYEPPAEAPAVRSPARSIVTLGSRANQSGGGDD